MDSLLQKYLGMFPPGASKMINWPRTLIIWGWCLHQYCVNWVLLCSQKKNPKQTTHWTEAWRLDLLCLMKLEIRYNNKSLWDCKQRFGQAQSSQQVNQGKPLLYWFYRHTGSFSRAGATGTQTPTISAPLEMPLSIFSPNSALRLHG